MRPRVGTELTSLGHKHFVQRIDGDDGAHRFQHIMIRDTAYDGYSSARGQTSTSGSSPWADGVNRDREAEFEEILGYHLEQAWIYLSELGPLDDQGLTIGADGSRRLASAGRRAFVRGDISAAAALLGRAAALLPNDDTERLQLLPEHGEALLMTGRFEEASAALAEAIESTTVAPAAAARASLVRLLVRLRTGDPEGWEGPTVEQEISGAIDVFERVGDDAGLAMAWRLRSWARRRSMPFRRDGRCVDGGDRARPEGRGRPAGAPRGDRLCGRRSLGPRTSTRRSRGASCASRQTSG